ncbi:20318_t:CDS:1, partial [Gigaspora margarita]
YECTFVKAEIKRRELKEKGLEKGLDSKFQHIFVAIIPSLDPFSFS